MTEFKNVSVQKKSNIYYDGNVTSTKIIFEDGSIKRLGIIQPGEYEFNSKGKEIMEILFGELEVMLPGSAGWQTINTEETFEVPASSKFMLKVHEVTNYCRSYIE